MRSRTYFVLLLATLLMRLPGTDCGCVYAGDEVDYSAPYFTVENGRLVTEGAGPTLLGQKAIKQAYLGL